MSATLPPPRWARPFHPEARRTLYGLRGLHRASGPAATTAAVHRLDARAARSALALALITEGWAPEAKAAIAITKEESK